MVADDNVVVSRGGRRSAWRSVPGDRRALTRFREDRCFDTPLAESGIVGFAVAWRWWAIDRREMQFDAFAYPAFEQ